MNLLQAKFLYIFSILLVDFWTCLNNKIVHTSPYDCRCPGIGDDQRLSKLQLRRRNIPQQLPWGNSLPTNWLALRGCMLWSPGV
jgi:hypothetical protein